MTRELKPGCLRLAQPWGTFSPYYLGASRIMDDATGARLDFPLLVGRRLPDTAILPDNVFGFVPHVGGERRAIHRAVAEGFSADYRQFGIRYFLDSHGDQAVARFQVLDEDRLACEFALENRSAEPREYYWAVGAVPTNASKQIALKDELRDSWLPAHEYDEIHAYRRSFDLGARQCVVRTFRWGVENDVLAGAFGCWPGDRVRYRTALPRTLGEGFIYFRYVKYGEPEPRWQVRVNGRARDFRFLRTCALPGGSWGKGDDALAEWRLLRVPVGSIEAGELELDLAPLDAACNDQAQIWLDGMLITNGLLPGDDGRDGILPASLADMPADGAAGGDFVALDGGGFRVSSGGHRQWCVRIASAVDGMELTAGNGPLLAHLQERFGAPESDWRDTEVDAWGLAVAPDIEVPAGEARTVCFEIGVTRGAVEAVATARAADGSHAIAPIERPADAPFSTMIHALQDALLYNINYPMRVSHRHSAFFVPSKWFGQPYFWDGGLVALGLVSSAREMALQQINYFLGSLEAGEAPFLYYGSPVPTPLYALWALWQQNPDRATLAALYPRARRMHDFYMGRTEGSVVNAAGDGLLNTYPYNYNLGIDDHPIQRWAEAQGVTEKGLYSLILIAQILRTARIMRAFAAILGAEEDVALYSEDITLLSRVIDERMWDEDSGLYGWLHETEEGVRRPVVGGCSGDRSAMTFLPLFAGLTSHRDRLVELVRDPQRFWTPYGVSSVDMSAPYYDPDGYWNGCVWAVAQWFVWRALIEAGEPDLARDLAMNILRAWQCAWDSEHYLGEYVRIRNGRMGGAPNFGGLSAVLLPMHAAYFEPFTVTAPHDVTIIERERGVDGSLVLRLDSRFLDRPGFHLLATMPGRSIEYEVAVDGSPVASACSDEFGHAHFSLPKQDDVSTCRIAPANPRAGNSF